MTSLLYDYLPQEQIVELLLKYDVISHIMGGRSFHAIFKGRNDSILITIRYCNKKNIYWKQDNMQ
jgi:hypothetical protein